MHTDIWLVEMGIAIKLQRYATIIKKFIKLSTLVAMLSVILLIIIGFFPTLKIANLYMFLILITTLLPMPLFMILTKQMIKPNEERIEKLLWNASEKLCSLREKYTNKI